MEICENMQKLRSYLDEKKIKWVDQSEEMGSASFEMIICRTWLWLGDRKISVINGFGTIGGVVGIDGDNAGLLEIAVDGLAGVYGNLTADDVIRIIEMIEEFGDDRIDKVFDEINKIGE